jgi:hypothetical protein
MKNRIAILFGVVLASGVAWMAMATDTVSPAQSSPTFARSESYASVSGGPFYKGATLLLTNCFCSSGTGLSPTQGLSGVICEIKVGNATTTWLTTTGTVQSAASGTFWVSFVIPTNADNSCILQLKLTDAATNSYVYPWKTIPVRSAL